MSRLTWVSILLAGSLALVASTAAAAPDQEKKEYVCHFTASAKNPVVVINVGNKAVDHHSANHHPDVHQGTDSSANEPPEDCEDGEGEG